MRVPWLVVLNVFPILAALIVVAFPARMLGRTAGYFANSFLATTTYVLSLAGLVRGTRAWRERVAARHVGRER
jgi:hypothetical protein